MEGAGGGRERAGGRGGERNDKHCMHIWINERKKLETLWNKIFEEI
jgi:hypothetical protein